MGSRMDTPFGESADLRALTLCMKLSMSLVYQLIFITTAAAANALSVGGYREGYES
jgi:hypothetical protein